MWQCGVWQEAAAAQLFGFGHRNIKAYDNIFPRGHRSERKLMVRRRKSNKSYKWIWPLQIYASSSQPARGGRRDDGRQNLSLHLLSVSFILIRPLGLSSPTFLPLRVKHDMKCLSRMSHNSLRSKPKRRDDSVMDAGCWAQCSERGVWIGGPSGS